MTQDIRLWEIVDRHSLKEIKHSKLDFEDRLEEWLEKDISALSPDLLVIGRQVETDYGGFIDLLCIDYKGDLVILELKRQKTPRDITAQALDYASWVDGLSNDGVTALANGYLKDKGPLEVAFKAKFGDDVPETLNEQHEMLIVASEIDGATERIVNYLSNRHGVAINAATFNYFEQDEKEYVARVFLIEPETVERRTQKGTTKRKPPLTREQLQEIAESNGVGELYAQLVKRMEPCFDGSYTTRSNIGFIATMGEKKARNTVVSIHPANSTVEKGLHVVVCVGRIAEHLGVDIEKVRAMFPGYETKESWGEAGSEWGEAYIRDKSEVDRVLSDLQAMKGS